MFLFYPTQYFQATIPMLHEWAAVLLRNVVFRDKTLTRNLPAQSASGTSAPHLVQPQNLQGTPNFGTPQYSYRGFVPPHYRGRSSRVTYSGLGYYIAPELNNNISHIFTSRTPAHYSVPPGLAGIPRAVAPACSTWKTPLTPNCP